MRYKKVNQDVQRVYDFWKSGATQRYHILRSSDVQTVADHTWGVVTLLLLLFPDCSKETMTAVILHDMPETYMGDMPFPAKRSSSTMYDLMGDLEKMWFDGMKIKFPDLSDEETLQLKICDILECAMYSFYQVHLRSNREFHPILQRATKHAFTLLEGTNYELARQVTTSLCQVPYYDSSGDIRLYTD